VAYIHVDGETEQQELKGRNTDDHPERQAIPGQLAELLDDDCQDALQ
jgi:hypothetical protein